MLPFEDVESRFYEEGRTETTPTDAGDQEDKT
jgi:hypothetical protein